MAKGKTKKTKDLVPIGGTYFPSVKKARQRLMERADEILEKYLKVIDLMVVAEQYEVANDAFQYLIEHMPREDGESIIAESAAKPKQIVDNGPRGPVIQIGLKVGGTEKDKLPEPLTIEVEPE